VGPVLVEPRPSRHQKDGKTILVKAQERKRMTNLEDGMGEAQSSNTFSVLSNSKFAEIASTIGVSSGRDNVV
jgi:hypothetical protein